MFSGMFGPSKRTLSKKDAETLAQYQEDKLEREKTAKSAFQSEQQMEDMFKDINGNKPSGPLGARRNNAERSKFVFKDDESDDELAQEDENDEDQINAGIDGLTDIVGRLKGAAIGMGGNLTTQNERLDRLAGKVSSLTTNLDYLVTFANMISQTDAVDDRVRHPWHANFSAGSSYLGLSHLTSRTEPLWLLNTAATLRTLLPRYHVVHLPLTCNRTGPDEPREVEPHPLDTANTSHQYNVACTSQNPDSGPRYTIQFGSDSFRNSVGVYGFMIGILITVLSCTRTCEKECMHGRQDDESRSPNENVSQLALLSNPRSKTISRASFLPLFLSQRVCSQTEALQDVVDCPNQPLGLVQDLRVFLQLLLGMLGLLKDGGSR